MRRDRVRLTTYLLAAAFAAGCGGSPRPQGTQPDCFETDDTRDLAKEQPVNGPPQSRTLWPAGDVDFIRFRVDELDADGGDTDGPHYAVTFPTYTSATYVEWWDDLGAVVLDVDPHYRMSDGGFTVPGIYYIKVYDDGQTGGKYQTWISFQRHGAGYTRDLVATAMLVPAEVGAGEEAAFSVWLVNQGGATAGSSFNVALYLSTDRTRDAGDTFLASERVEYDLGAGYSYSLPISVASFPSVPVELTGPAYLIAVVDSGSEVNEFGYEDNNLFVGSTLVEPADYEATAGPEPASAAPTPAAPTVTQRRRMLYPAGDDTPGQEVDADVDLVELEFDVGLRYYEIWTEKLTGWADTRLEIVDAAGDPLEPPIEAEDGGLENGASYLLVDRQTLEVMGSGPWSVKITDEQGNSGGYDLVVRGSPDDPGTANWFGPDEFEPDGTAGTWRVLRESSPARTRTFSTADDEDWVAYPVPVPDGGRNHTIETHSISGCDTVLELYNSKGKLLPYSAGPGGETGSSRLGPFALGAGLYYVRVTDQAAQAGGTYGLSATVADF